MNLYHVYYNQQDRAVCVERQGSNGIIKVIAGIRPTSLYSRMLVTDTFTLSEAIDEALLTKQEKLNKSKGNRYQRSPEMEREIKLGCSHSALKAKYGLSKASFYRIRNELV
ncbi:hypothetical protein WP8S18E11_06200 [Aeromonas veronii]|nr:hypothetical protein WP8S18E11_06200 [Aeromonas veronii]